MRVVHRAETERPRHLLRVKLRDVETGRTAWHEEQWAEPDFPEEVRWDTLAFYWTDGNAGCDCNRGEWLATALGLPDDDPLRSLSCAGRRIVVDEATIGGERLQIEDRP